MADPVEQLRQGMIAAAAQARRGQTRIELVPEDRPEGVSEADLRLFEAVINTALGQMRAIAQSSGAALSTVVLAHAAAIGAVIAQDCHSTDAATFAELASQRLMASFNQMRSQ